MHIPATFSTPSPYAKQPKAVPHFGMAVARDIATPFGDRGMAVLRTAADDVFSVLAGQSAQNQTSLYTAFLTALTNGDQAAMKGFLMMKPIRLALGTLSEDQQQFLLQQAHAEVRELLVAALLKIQEQTARALSSAGGRRQIRG